MGPQHCEFRPGLFLCECDRVMSSRPWKDRQFDAARLVVAKPNQLGSGYSAGQRYRPDREAINPRRVRQLWDQRVLVTDDEWRRSSDIVPMVPEDIEEPAKDDEPEDWTATLDRGDVQEQLRDLGHTTGMNAQTETLRQRLRDALEA